MEENKKNYALWLYPETVRRMDSSLELANCQSRSEFVEKALHFSSYDRHMIFQCFYLKLRQERGISRIQGVDKSCHSFIYYHIVTPSQSLFHPPGSLLSASLLLSVRCSVHSFRAQFLLYIQKAYIECEKHSYL